MTETLLIQHPVGRAHSLFIYIYIYIYLPSPQRPAATLTPLAGQSKEDCQCHMLCLQESCSHPCTALHIQVREPCHHDETVFSSHAKPATNAKGWTVLE